MKFSSIWLLLFLFIGSEAEAFQSLAKAIIYAENGDMKKAYESIYRHDLTNSAIVGIIMLKVKKDVSAVQNNFEFAPDLEDKFKDRISFELSKIMFDRGEYVEAKDKISGILQKSDNAKFIMANVAFLEGDYVRADKLISDIEKRYTDDNKVYYKALERAIKEKSSPVFFSADFFSSALFIMPNPPVQYENLQTSKKWDISSNLYGRIYGEFLKPSRVYPFLGYEFAGEFYTDIEGFTLHSLSVGGEYAGNFVAGGRYSFLISTFRNDIFSQVHKFSSYIFPGYSLFFRINFGFESKSIIDEKEGMIPSAEMGARLEGRFGNVIVGSLPILWVGKRFGKTPRFSELFISPYLGNYLRVGDFQFNLNLFSNFMKFPEKFEGRATNILWFAEIFPSFSKEFVRLDFVRLSIEGNLSDSASFLWSRVRVGTSISMVF